LPEIRRLAERWPIECLGAWFAPDVSENWRFVIREVFRDWSPQRDQIERLTETLCPLKPFPQKVAALRLMEFFPILMGRYLKTLAKVSPPQDMRALSGMLRKEIEGQLRAEVRDHFGSDETFHDGIERKTKLNPEFLKTLNAAGIAAVLDLRPDTDFDQRRNLDLVATQFTACRLLVALDIIQSLEEGALAYWKGGRCETS
jgi:hypothetical protein